MRLHNLGDRVKSGLTSWGCMWNQGRCSVDTEYVLRNEDGSAQRMQSSRYLMRYTLTGLLLAGAIKCPPLNAAAAAIPLFFPKLILIASGIFHRKGG